MFVAMNRFAVRKGSEAFEVWTRSEALRAAHRDAGGNKPLYLDHPMFEGFEVMQTVAPRPAGGG